MPKGEWGYSEKLPESKTVAPLRSVCRTRVPASSSQGASEGVTVDDNEVGVGSGCERSHALPAKNTSGVARPGRERLFGREPMLARQRDLLENVLGAPVAATADRHPAVHELAQRHEAGEQGLAEAFADHLLLAPAKADAGGHLEARCGVPSDVFGFEEVPC